MEIPRAELAAVTFGVSELGFGGYEAYADGDYRGLQNTFASYAVLGSINARFKSPKCPKVNTKPALQEIKELGQLKGKSATEIEAQLKAAGYTPVKAKNGGTIWTKTGADGNTAAVRIDPANLKNIRGYADEVPHVHKEIVPTADVVNGNYKPPKATTLDDSGNVTVDKQKTHIPGGH